MYNKTGETMPSTSPQLADGLDAETQKNLNSVPNDICGNQTQIWNPCDEKYTDKSVVQSGEDAKDAFDKYTEYYTHILENWTPSSERLVLIPCGSSKPIGSSTIHQKKVIAVREGGLSDADVVILSEPCTIVPAEYRLSLPAVNYDFPPEYTEKEAHPEVFEVFTSRLAQWLVKMEYDEIYPYLISGHQNKFDAALEKCTVNADVYSIPTASYNPESESYCGDRFKKQREMTMKVKAVLKHKAKQDVSIPQKYDEFYGSYFSE